MKEIFQLASLGSEWRHKKTKKISRGRVERPISRFRSDKLQSCALNQLGYREYLIVEEKVYYVTHIQLKKRFQIIIRSFQDGSE